MTQVENKKQFYQFEKMYEIAFEKQNIELLRKAFNLPFFLNASKDYQQLCMDTLVISGYKSEKLAKWSLTNTEMKINGNINENDGRPLRLAIEYNTEFAKYLLTSSELKEKARIHSDNEEYNALCLATKKGSLNFVKYLLTSSELPQRADILEAKTQSGDALYQACKNNHTEIIQYFLTSKELKNKADISRFNYAGVKEVIAHDNINIFNLLIEKNLIDIASNKQEYFNLAIIYDAVNIVNKLYSSFNKEPNLNTIQYENKNLFYHIAKHVHYSKVSEHSFFFQMLEKTGYIPSEEERKEMSHFYLYQMNKPVISLLELLKKRDEKIAIQTRLNIKAAGLSIKRKI